MGSIDLMEVHRHNQIRLYRGHFLQSAFGTPVGSAFCILTRVIHVTRPWASRVIKGGCNTADRSKQTKQAFPFNKESFSKFFCFRGRG